MPVKPCRFPGCPELLPDQGKAWCSRHAASVDKSYNRPGDKLYDTKRWRIRSRHFLTERPLCAICGKLAQAVDHVAPYESEEVLSFWVEANWQPLCLPCHGQKTNADIRRRAFR